MLEIDRITYELPDSNFIKKATNKKRIVIGGTNNSNMRHYIGWLNRYNGEYTKTAMYTISIYGEVFEHFNPDYYSHFLDKISLNKTTISIVLENEGWLTKVLGEENKYINYIGHIYNRDGEVLKKKWRNKTYWATYSREQMLSVVELIKRLTSDFNIPMNSVEHITTFKGSEDFEGILYKSNLNKKYTDINPSWDCLEMKNKLDNYE